LPFVLGMENSREPYWHACLYREVARSNAGLDLTVCGQDGVIVSVFVSVALPVILGQTWRQPCALVASGQRAPVYEMMSAVHSRRRRGLTYQTWYGTVREEAWIY